MLTLNVVIQTQMMLNAQVAQIWQLSWKKTKKLHKLILVNCKLKLREIAEDLKISEGSVFTILQSGCCVCSQLIKNNNVSTIQSVVCNCFNTTKRSFCINMWKWMKHGSTTSLQSQIGSQLSGQQQVIAVQGDQSCKHQQARFWPLHFGMHKVFCSSITLRKEDPSIANIILYYWCFWWKKSTKTATNEKEKSALSPRQCTVSQVDCKDGKTTWIAL